MIQGFGIVCLQCRRLNSETATACDNCKTSLLEPNRINASKKRPNKKPYHSLKPVRKDNSGKISLPKPLPRLPAPSSFGTETAKLSPIVLSEITEAKTEIDVSNELLLDDNYALSEPANHEITQLNSHPVDPQSAFDNHASTSSATHGRFAELIRAAEKSGDFDDNVILEWMRQRGVSGNEADLPTEILPAGFLEAFREEALEESRIQSKESQGTWEDAFEEDFFSNPEISGEEPIPSSIENDIKNDLAAQQVALESPMERRDQILCGNCGAPIHPGHKFCGKCGTSVEELSTRRPPTDLFGPLQKVGKAKLVLIKGEGLDGISYHLNARDHIAGRTQGAILFPDDPFLSPRHACFFYRDDKLLLRDEGSLNGVFIRLRESLPLTSGDFFLCGEEIFRFEAIEPDEDVADPDGTYFFASPKRRNYFRLVQILVGGREGLRYHAKRKSLVIGRERCDLNFPLDRFISGSHSKVEVTETGFRLSDMGSRNGTFLRIHGEMELGHGDYVFLGQQLLRVEITLE